MIGERIIRIEKGLLEISLQYGNTNLSFENIKEFSINEYDKILIVGKNGSGKSRLLEKLEKLIRDSDDKIKIIRIDEDSHYIARKNNQSVGEMVTDLLITAEKKIEESPRGIKTVILIDDLVAGLDRSNYKKILQKIIELNCTVIITERPGNEITLGFHPEDKIDDYPNKIMILDTQSAKKITSRTSDPIISRKLLVLDKIGDLASFYNVSQFFQIIQKRKWLLNTSNKLLLDIRRSERREKIELNEKTDGFEGIMIKELSNLKMKLGKRNRDIDIILEAIDDEEDDLKKSGLIQESQVFQNESHYLLDAIRQLEIKLEKINYMKEYPLNKLSEEALRVMERLYVIISEIKTKTHDLGLLGDRYNHISIDLLEKVAFDLKIDDVDLKREKAVIDIFADELRELQDEIIELFSQKRSAGLKKKPEEIMGIRDFVFDPIVSSLSMILCDSLSVSKASDELRKLALYYAKNFRPTTFSRRGNGLKIIIVNTIEKVLKYSINTYEDRENTRIIIHPNSKNKVYERTLREKHRNAMTFMPTKRLQVSTIIMDCDGEVGGVDLRRYLNKYRSKGTAENDHLLFIDLNNSYSVIKSQEIINHPFNKWIKNLEKRTKTRKQSQSAGLPKIIKVTYSQSNDGLTPPQDTKKAKSLLSGDIKKLGLEINKEWKEHQELLNENMFKYLNLEMIRYFSTIYRTEEVILGKRSLGSVESIFLAIDDLIHERKYKQALEYLDEIIEFFGRKRSIQGHDLISQLRLVLYYIVNGYINNPESSEMKNQKSIAINSSKLIRRLNRKEQMIRLPLGIVGENVDQDSLEDRFSGCIPNISFMTFMSNYIAAQNFADVNGTSFQEIEFGMELNLKNMYEDVRRNTHSRNGPYSEGNIFQIEFSPLMGIVIPEYNFRFEDKFFCSDFESQIKHLRSIKETDLQVDQDSLWSRLGLGLHLIFEEKREEDLWVIMELCDKEDLPILFQMLVTTISNSFYHYTHLIKTSMKNSDIEEIIEQWLIEGKFSLRELITVLKIVHVPKLKNICIENIINDYDFEKNKDLYKQLWKEDLKTEDSLEEWHRSLIKY